MLVACDSVLGVAGRPYVWQIEVLLGTISASAASPAAFGFDSRRFDRGIWKSVPNQGYCLAQCPMSYSREWLILAREPR